ncbi:MAG: hypothetical protein JSU61_08770 [Fidelibacterota bacterium]|nr:MAG: hypothetical protein JSU61_08770 [Candidatus Neomarinimicrobiota bacterium]
MKVTIYLMLGISISMSGLAYGQQEEGILPAQAKAIRSLAREQGFTLVQLNTYLTTEWGAPLYSLSREDGAELIRLFQSDNPPAPPAQRTATVTIPEPTPVSAPRQEEPPPPIEPILAEILEVGMSKRFHLVDGNLIQGTIVRKEDDVCHIETIDGLLKIPAEKILAETAHITKKNDTRYVGPVMKETPEEILLRSPYGDVVISKKDIKDMDRYHGGRKVRWAEERRTFYRGEAVLTDVLMDPTAFPLPANTVYLSGLSLGYAFTDRFMVRSSFGSDFTGDLNLHPMFQFYSRETGVSEVGAAIGFHMFNHHPMETLVAKYAKYVMHTSGVSLHDSLDLDVNEVMLEDQQDFYWETYLVLSSRRSLATGRGKMGWHLGIKTNSLILSQPALASGYSWDMESLVVPFHAWAAFEYDLSKRLKLQMKMWADNGHKFRTVSQTIDDYLADGTAFVLDSPSGEYRMVDFDFGFLYAFGETLRLGLHFQEPYLLLYWEFYEL